MDCGRITVSPADSRLDLAVVFAGYGEHDELICTDVCVWDMSDTLTCKSVITEETSYCKVYLLNVRYAPVMPERILLRDEAWNGHDYSESSCQAATCTENGWRVFSCSVCGDSYEAAIPAKGHDWSEWMKYDADMHFRVCTYNDTHREYGDHTFDNTGSCNECEYVLTEYEKLLNEVEDLGLLEHLNRAELEDADAPITRLQACKLAVAVIGLDIPEDVTVNEPFSDVEHLTNVEKFIIAYLANKDVVPGYNDGTFNPNGQLSNAGMIRYLHNALDNPVVDAVKTNDFEWHQHYFYLTMMDNLGIVDVQEIQPNAAVVMEDALQWAVNSKTWRKENPENPEYLASNVRIEGSQMIWDNPTMPAGIGRGFGYIVRLESDSNIIGCGAEDPCLNLYSLMGGIYHTITIDSYFYFGTGNVYCGSYTVPDLELHIFENDGNAATVSFTPTADNLGYDMVLSDLTPNAEWNIYFGKAANQLINVISGTSTADGTYTETFLASENSSLMDRISYDSFLLREYYTFGFDATGTIYMICIENRGDWTKCLEGSSGLPVVYEVSNIRFEGQYLKWDEPIGVSDFLLVEYRVWLSKDGEATWDPYTHQVFTSSSTNILDFERYRLNDETHYNKICVETLVEGVRMASVVEDIDLTIVKAKSPAVVTFTPVEGLADTYSITIIGLNPNSYYVLDTATRIVIGDVIIGTGASISYTGQADADGCAYLENCEISALDGKYYCLIEYSEDTPNLITYGDWTNVNISHTTNTAE